MTRIERDIQTVSLMIRMYCRKKEGNKELCNDSKILEQYAQLRLESCKYGNLNTSCKKCTTHCYRKDMREKIREVMRFSGPRMLLYQPFEAVRHMFER